MEKTVFNVPAMYADHHVTKVRQTLLALRGVEDVYASAAFKQVLVTHDPATLSADAIAQALAAAGYPVGDGQPGALVSFAHHQKDLAWDALAVRETTTSLVDLQMSGEFRKY